MDVGVCVCVFQVTSAVECSHYLTDSLTVLVSCVLCVFVWLVRVKYRQKGTLVAFDSLEKYGFGLLALWGGSSRGG